MLLSVHFPRIKCTNMLRYSRLIRYISFNTFLKKESKVKRPKILTLKGFTNVVYTNLNFTRNSSNENIAGEENDAKAFGCTDQDADGFELKSLLYGDSCELIRAINKCNQEELLELLQNRKLEITAQHRVQAVIALWALHKDSDADDKTSQINEELLKVILDGLQPHILALNISELSFCYLYLRKMNVPNTDEIVRDLLIEALKKVQDIDLVPLPTLSRLSIGVNTGYNFYTPMIFANFMPHIERHLKKCYDHETARLIAICMYNTHQIVDEQMLDAFKACVQELLDANIINAQTTKTIFKLLHLFNLPTWSNNNALIIRNLLLTLKPNIEQFNDTETKILCRIFQHHLEPASLEYKLKNAIEQLLQHNPDANALASYMPFMDPIRREPLIKLFKQLIGSNEQWQTPHAAVNFFNILRTLKIAEAKVCDTYWQRILNDFENVDKLDGQQQNHIIRHCHRYMHFNNNLGGTYRYLPLEEKLSKAAMNAIENELMGSIPWKFARLASFVMAYGHTPYGWKKFPNTILSKIISMSAQFSPTDCFYISRGIAICLEMRFRFHTPTTLNMQLSTIDSILNACIERHLQTYESMTIQNLNTIVRTLNNRKTLKNSLVHQQVMNKYKTLNYVENLNSRTMRDLAYILAASNYSEPKSLSAMLNYIKDNHEHIFGDSVEKVLTCAYNLGYAPDSLDAFEYAAQVIIRDFDFMSGLSIVQACLALCFYKIMPEALIDKVFCVNFIKRIEDEIHLCYSKATYPDRVLNLVMQLNRTVCLDFPEANVPWFQQNFVEAQLSKKLFVRNQFSAEVKSLLKKLFKSDVFFCCNHTTPYGYQIDFVIHFDENRKPLPTPAETTLLDRITKVAILLLKLDSFCENDLTALRGPDSLKIKHLEMMGYKVLHINEHDWNSKYMNAPDAKANYLKCLLQISS